MTKPIKVFYSDLSGRFYASNKYKVTPKVDGTGEYITITGEKYDVTDDIAKAVIGHGIRFSEVTND